LGTIRIIWNMGKKYHSDNISKGVANGSASSPIINGSRISNPTLQYFQRSCKWICKFTNH
jgi:hypothetical protein